jgi:hypothetical protein
VVAADAVGDAVKTRALFDEWHGQIHSKGFPVAYVLQDGQLSCDVPWNDCAAIFVGGTDAFKESMQALALMHEAKARGKWIHMGRVNTLRRLRFAHTAGCDSIDGSKFSWYSDTYLPQFLDKMQWLCSEQGELTWNTL